MREAPADGKGWRRAESSSRSPTLFIPMRRCAWAQGAGRTLLVALVALASKSVADERQPIARCAGCPPRPALARRTATTLSLAQHPCLTLRGGGRSRRDQAARGGSQKGSREGGHNGRAEARNDESAAPPQSVDQVMREDQSRSSTHAPGKHQATSIADPSAPAPLSGIQADEPPLVTHVPMSPSRLAALREAMDKAPPEAADLWSREMQEEEWQHEGVLPPSGQRPSGIRFDSRGIFGLDDEGHLGDGIDDDGHLDELGEGPSPLGGGSDAGLSRDWVQRMSKILDEEVRAEGEVDDVSEGPMSSFGGRKQSMWAGREGARESDSDGERKYGDEPWRGEEDERTARQDELLRGLDAIYSHDAADGDLEQAEQERLMSRCLSPHRRG